MDGSLYRDHQTKLNVRFTKSNRRWNSPSVFQICGR
jgi:hypothetical protein